MDGGQAKAWTQNGSGKAPALTAAALDKRLNLRRRAREDAARNLPGPQAQDLSEAERGDRRAPGR